MLLHGERGVPIKAWVRGVPFEDAARRQVENAACLPFVHKWIAVMPDVPGTARRSQRDPTLGAIVPAAVGVDIGCGMMAVRSSAASALPDDLKGWRSAIGARCRTVAGRARQRDRARARSACARRRGGASSNPDSAASSKRRDRAEPAHAPGTLGTGNHFIEVCLDEADRVWFMLHSGSRGIGNRIGSYFIGLAKRDLARLDRDLPDKDLAYFEEGAVHFGDYVAAVEWAQRYARVNRELMMQAILEALAASGHLPPFQAHLVAVNCHHNYVQREHHYGKDVFVTRKGAVRAGLGELGIIPGSMGAKSYIVRGLGNPESFESCSHGAGRAMSRNQASRASLCRARSRDRSSSAARQGRARRTPAASKSSTPPWPRSRTWSRSCTRCVRWCVKG